MKGTTTDRGDVIHFAGFHHLSPALDQGAGPAFSAEPGDGLARCGWERLFAAMRERGLALAYDGDDPSSARFVRTSQTTPHAGPDAGEVGAHAPGGLGAAVEHARRFWKALFPPRPPPPAA